MAACQTRLSFDIFPSITNRESSTIAGSASELSNGVLGSTEDTLATSECGEKYVQQGLEDVQGSCLVA
jgi:hypothetical protein